MAVQCVFKSCYVFCLPLKRSAAAKAETRRADGAHMCTGDNPRQDPNECVVQCVVQGRCSELWSGCFLSEWYSFPNVLGNRVILGERPTTTTTTWNLFVLSFVFQLKQSWQDSLTGSGDWFGQTLGFFLVCGTAAEPLQINSIILILCSLWSFEGARNQTESGRNAARSTSSWCACWCKPGKTRWTVVLKDGADEEIKNMEVRSIKESYETELNSEQYTEKLLWYKYSHIVHKMCIMKLS